MVSESKAVNLKNRPKTGRLPLKTDKNRAKPITKRQLIKLIKLPELKNKLRNFKDLGKLTKHLQSNLVSGTIF